MTSASVALHESNLSLHADTLVLCWMCVHHGKVMRHLKPDERRITHAFEKTGRLHAVPSAGPVVPSQPCQLLRLAKATISAQPSLPSPLSPEAADSRHKRNRPQQMGPLTLAGPFEHCVLVTCHLLLFSGLTTLQDIAFQSRPRHKRERVRKSWRGRSSLLLKLLSKSQHQEKNQIKSQQKQSTPSPTKTCLTPLWLPTPPYKTGPLGGDKKTLPTETYAKKVPVQRPFAILQNGRHNAFTEKWGPAILSWRGKDMAGEEK